MLKAFSPKTVGILFTVVGFSIFAFGDLTLKITGQGYSPFEVALYMNYFTIISIIPVVFYCGGFKKVMTTQSLKRHALRSYFMLINFLCIIYALTQLSMASVYLIVFTMPFILNILAIILFKERISILRWAAIFLGFLGVLLAMRPGVVPFDFAILFLIAGTACNACAIITVKTISKQDHWLSYTCYVMIFQTPILAALVLLKGGSLLPDFTDTKYLPWFIIGGSAYVAALSLLPQALQRIDASIIGALLYLVFPWGVFYGYYFFGDVPDSWTLGGAVIIILSGIFLIYREHKENSKLLD